MGGSTEDWRRWAGIGLAVLVLSAIAVYVLAPLAVDTSGFKKAAEREQAKNNARTTTVQFLGVIGLAVGAFLTGQTFRLNRQGQITDRFTKAVDQLGNENAEVRVGGTYALERIARESPEDRQHIVEILTNVLRGEPKQSPTAEGGMSTDRQAALRVLGRRPPEGEVMLRLALEGADLRRANLRGHPLGAEGHYERATFRYARLEGAELRDGHFYGSDFSDAHLEGADLTDAELAGADFARVSAQAARFQGTTMPLQLSSADLHGAILLRVKEVPPGLTELRLDGAMLVDLDLGEADLSRSSMPGAVLNDVTLTGANLTGAVLRGARLHRCDLSGATLDGVDIRGLLFSETTWPAGFDPIAAGATAEWEATASLRSGSLDAAVDARGVSLPEGETIELAQLDGTRLRGAWLEGVALAEALLRGADLRGARLKAATLVQASLADADLRGADLTEADLAKADLARADLRGAKLAGANLTGTDLTTALVGGAHYDRHTIWPRGFDPSARAAVPRGRLFEPERR
jgi:uncharacterized protein YjbI with pentapeptide repeats